MPYTDDPTAGLPDANGKHHQRRVTHPFRKSRRSKPRRWPLVLRFIKGAIHGAIVIPVLCHALFTVVVVCLDKYIYDELGLPTSIIPSLSIVVGLILVFRNQTSFNRFWEGRNCLGAIHNANRNLARTILTHSYNRHGPLTEAEKQDIERTIRILIAFPYAVKHYLRAEWGASTATSCSVIAENADEVGSLDPEYSSLLPAGFEPREAEGLSIPLQLSFFVDSFIKRGVERGWYDAPGASQMGNQVNVLIDAYGRMETIKLTPIPVAHLIHQKQVLALFGCVLPFAMVDDMGWWAVPIVSLVTFTLYGIEGIGSQLEDPFGYDRNDIKMDAIVEDARVEIEAILNEWKRVTELQEGPEVNGHGNSNGFLSNGSSNENGPTNGYGRTERREMFIR
ncbi:hypothetical protein VTO42DRAFT_7866 [Malbranchea cinnamomea]